jgi:hypothetical protein
VGEIYGSHNMSILAREVDYRRLEVDKVVDAEDASFSSWDLDRRCVDSIDISVA